MEETKKENDIIEIKAIMGNNEEDSLNYIIEKDKISVPEGEPPKPHERSLTKEEFDVIAKFMQKYFDHWKGEYSNKEQNNKIWSINIKYANGDIEEISGDKFPDDWHPFLETFVLLVEPVDTVIYDENLIKVLIYVVLLEQEPEKQTISRCIKYIFTHELMDTVYLKYPDNHQIKALFNSVIGLTGTLYVKVLAETQKVLQAFLKKFPEKDSLENIKEIEDIDDLAEKIIEFAKENRQVYIDGKREEIEETEINNGTNDDITYSNNYNELKKMKFSSEIENLLSPLANPSIKGLRCAFVGEEGTDKERVINNIATYLFKIGKIVTSKPEQLRLSAEFIIREDRLYYVSEIQDFIEDFENNDDFSSVAEEQRKNKNISIQKLINQIRGKYIILDCSQIELKRFLAVNPKLPYIFDTTVFFDDLKDEEVLELLENILPNYHKKLITDEVKKEILDYINKNRRYLPFKNKDLSTYLATYISRKENITLPKDRYNEKTLEEMFKDLVGMNNVKQQLIELRDFLKLRNKLEKQGKKIPKFNLHMMFLGNAGTGKTTVARMVAKILFDLGYINENKLIEVEAKDLIAAYSGQTPLKTSRVISSALGGVLFIDEAYSLVQTSGDTGAEAISTLVKAMEDYKEDLVVIFAGYSKEMQEFIRANSGIQSRIGYTFEFADYTEEELYEIFKLKAEKVGLAINEEAEKKLREIINFGRHRKNFGNGRYIDNLLQKTLVKQASLNLNDEDILNLTADSIPTVEEILTQASGERKPDEIEEVFENIVGMDKIKKEVIALGKYIQFRNKLSKSSKTVLPDLRLHMLFTGDAGTGKTTMARKVTEMLYNIGCIRINKLVEVERKDLVAEYVGQTAVKTEKVIESALGGVLFIDEAYSLTPKAGNGSTGDYGSEAIATLIKAMEDYKDELVVIFAGYTKEMKDFVNSNSGIASRIGYTFEFENYKDEELYEIFKIKCKNYSLKISDDVKEKVMEILKYFSSVENFGNGRFVDKLLQEILIKHSMNEKLEENIDNLMVDDIPSIKDMVEKTFNNEENIVLPSDVDDESRRWTGIHEIGHALIEYLHNGETTLKVITVIPEGNGALGYVLHTVPKNKLHLTKRDYLNRIDVLLAGRAAEEVILGKVSSGSWNDLEKASKLMDIVLSQCGMSDTLGLINTKGSKVGLEMTQNLDKEKKYLLETCYNETKKMIEDNRRIFDIVINDLMEKGTMSGDDFLKLVKEN